MSVNAYAKEIVLECTGHHRICTDYRMITKCSLPDRIDSAVIAINGLKISSETSKFLEFMDGCSESDGLIICSYKNQVLNADGAVDKVTTRNLVVSRVTGEIHYKLYDGIPTSDPRYLALGENKRSDFEEYAGKCSVRANKRLF